MAAIKRHVAEIETGYKKDIGHILAEEMFELLKRYGDVWEEHAGDDMDMFVELTETEPYYCGDDNEGNKHLFRLRSVPTFGSASVVAPAPDDTVDMGRWRPSEGCVVIGVEHGTTDVDAADIGDVVEDDEFEWSPYVLAVIDRSNPNKLQFLNADNGTPLDNTDIMHLLRIMTGMRESFREDSYVGEIEFNEGQINPTVGYVPLEKDGLAAFQFQTANSCDDCDASNQLCTHYKGALN